MVKVILVFNEGGCNQMDIICCAKYSAAVYNIDDITIFPIDKTETRLLSNVTSLGKTFPLHPAQQNVFIDQLINNNSPQYNIGGYIILKGNLNKSKLHEVVNTASAVFDAFKMRFDASSSEMIGYIDEDNFSFKLSEIDFDKEENPADAAIGWMQDRMTLSFSLLKTNPLFEQVLLTIAADEHWLFGRFHHLIMDGYGFSIWMKYMADKYRSLHKFDPISFHYPSYIDEAILANSSVSKSDIAEDDGYWKKQILSKPEQLFFGKINVSPNEALTLSFTYSLTSRERGQLENAAQSFKAGIHQITIAALLIYFGKILDAKKIVFGLPIHKRNSKKLRNIVGLFNGFIPFAGVYDANQTIFDLVRSVVATQSADYRHQHFSISNLSQHLQLNPAEENIWEIIVNYLPFNIELDFGNELQASITQLGNQHGRIPLQVCWNDYGKHQPLELQIYFSKNYFEEDEIEIFTNRLLHILSQFSEKVNKLAKDITVLPSKEMEMLDKFGRTKQFEKIYENPLPFLSHVAQVRTVDGQLAGIGVKGKLYVAEESNEKEKSLVPSKVIDTGISVKWTPAGELVKVEESHVNLNSVEKHALRNVPLCISATFVADMLEEYLSYWSNEFELNLNINIAPYNQVFQQLLDAQSLFNSGEGINILLIRVEDWIRDQLGNSADMQVELLQTTCEQLILTVTDARKLSAKPCLFGIVPWILNTTLDPKVQQAMKDVEKKIKYCLTEMSLFYELDLRKAIELYEVDEIFDCKADEAGHIPFTDECFAAIGTYIARKVRAWKNPSYKVIAVDCDNTLWKGICGEVGPLNVVISEEYQYLQEFLIQKYTEGFLLIICSKNNEEDVWEVFDHHPAMKLRREHIATHKIDWQPKPSNLQSIADALNLGTGSFIFLDDNAYEIEQMEMACPEIYSLALPEDEAEISSVLNHTWAFDTFYITEEDRQRNSRYKVELLRKEDQEKFSNLKDFIVTLNVDVRIRMLGEKELERAVQLSLRTNQFNLNGIRMSYEEIQELLAENQRINWIVEVSDRFGDYGITGLVLAKQAEQELVLSTFLLSCRVLGRGVEDKILSKLIQYCKENGLLSIRGMFYATGKNKPFIEFLDQNNWIADTQHNSYRFLVN